MRRAALGKVILCAPVESFDMGRRSEDASLENRGGNRSDGRVGRMRRKLHASRGNIVSAGDSYLAPSDNYQRPAGTIAGSGTVHVHRNRNFHIHGELVCLPSAAKSYCEESKTVELRTTDRLWDNQHDGTVHCPPYTADAQHLRRRGAKHGEPEYLWNQLC
jgi:hypothetical protein